MLDLESFPLDGISLIEASAGTGKTYAVSNLVVRYILERDYRIDQILVVTFTEAATQELRVRLREKLAEFSAVYEQVVEYIARQEEGVEERHEARLRETETEHESEQIDERLASWTQDSLIRSCVLRSDDLARDLIRLRLAEQTIELAEVHTIHGFCQRIAREYSSHLCLPASQTLIEDETALKLEVCEDLWRSTILTLPESCIRFIRQSWSSPAALIDGLGVFGARQAERVTPTASGLENATDSIAWWVDAFTAYQDWVVDLRTLVEGHLSAVVDVITASDIKRPKDKLNWLSQMQDWLDMGAPESGIQGLRFERFFKSAIDLDVKSKGTPPEHMFFVAIERHFESQPSSLDALFLQAFHRKMSVTIAQKKAREGLVSFDDLILQVKSALKREELTEALVPRLWEKYRVALIDEFQDTDKHQYPIFSRLFGAELVNRYARVEGHSNTEGAAFLTPSLVLIGDPKQAIYGFRGGDMETYLRARRETVSINADRVFTMVENWRSSAELLNALNTLYHACPNPFLSTDIQYINVVSGPKKHSPEWGAALRFTEVTGLDEDQRPLNKETVTERLATRCAVQISELLIDRSVKVNSKDIAILVRDRNEAAKVRQALSNLGIKSSFDDRDSVFNTEEAFSLYALLKAVSEPSRQDYLRACMIDPIWGISDDRLSRLASDEGYAQSWTQSFFDLNVLWSDLGVLNMIRSALARFGTLDYWRLSESKQNQWERILSNIEQLAELLQSAASQFRTQTSLIDWLAREMLDEKAQSGKNREIRLESDDELVRIVTIHKSKGLEYPVVFLPFMFSSKDPRQAWFYDDQHRLCLALEATAEEKQLARRERLAEDCRLLYVALTRAKFRCYVGVCEFNGRSAVSFANTALGHLLSPGGSEQGDLEAGWLSQRLSHLAEAADIDYQFFDNETLVDAANCARFETLQSEQRDSYVGPRSSPNLRSDWRVQSFTGLMQEHLASAYAQHVPHMPVTVSDDPDFRKDSIDILNFPRGSEAGTFLHTLFEHISLETGELLPKYERQHRTLDQHIHELLVRKRLVPEKHQSRWAEYLARWLKTVLASPLGHGVSLGGLSESDYKVEAEFHFSLSRITQAELNAAIQEVYPERPPIVFEPFQGHIKGAIDLLFRSNGRYYVLDYKSNHLGFMAQDYTSQNLEHVMIEHRYDVQYLLYSLALHRVLQQRLGAHYDYEQHFGGSYYLFLRGLGLSSDRKSGVDASTEGHCSGSALPNGVYFVRPPRNLIEKLDALFIEKAGQSDYLLASNRSAVSQGSSEDGVQYE